MSDRLIPRRQSATIRDQLRATLSESPVTALELSMLVRISERDVVSHLEHLMHSLRRGPIRLELTAAECVACGFSFAERRRLTRPSRCPRCRSERISPPRFALAR